MRKYWALFRVNFHAILANFSVGGSSKKKKRAATGIAALAFMAFLGLYISTVYSFLFADMLAPAGLIGFVPILMSFITCLMSLMFTAFAASGIVFGNKDSDLMLSLPISAFSVMLSKILALYLENFAFSVFMMLPAGVVYLIKGGEGGALFAIRYFIANLFLPLLPTIFALLLGFLLAFFQAKVGRNAILGNLAYLGSFLILMYFMFRLQMMLPNLLSQSSSINNIFSTWLYPLGLFRDAIFGSNLALIMLALVLTLPFLALVYIMSTKYKKILTILASTKTKNDYKLSAMKAQGQIPSLLKKEFGKYFGTPIYVFNTGFGIIMAIMAAVAAVFYKETAASYITQMGVPVFPILILGVSFLCVTTASSCISISLEGKTLWILKEAPINARTMFMSKALVNMVLIWIIAIFTAPALWYAFNLSALEALAIFLISASLAPFVAFSGIIINLFFPKMDCANDALIVKQSTSAFLGVFSGMGVIGIGAGLVAILGNTLTVLTTTYIMIAILLLMSAAMWAFLITKGEKMLKQIS